MTSDTKYKPPIPEKIHEHTINDNIIPVVTNYEGGDVVFEGYGKSDLSDLDIDGEYYVVFDAVNKVINRFVIYEKYGSDFVIGWLYESENGIEMHVRADISIIYSKKLFSDDPTDINPKYDAYE